MCRWVCLSHLDDVCVLTVWQKTMSRRYCSDTSMAIVGAVSCMSRKTIDFLALSLIMATQSVSVVRRGYSASLHSPATNKPWETKHKYAFKPIVSTQQVAKIVFFRVHFLLNLTETEKKTRGTTGKGEAHTHWNLLGWSSRTSHKSCWKEPKNTYRDLTELFDSKACCQACSLINRKWAEIVLQTPVFM